MISTKSYGKRGLWQCLRSRGGWSFKAEEEACEGVPAEAEALPGDPGAGIGAYLEISGRIDGKEGKDIAPVPEPVDLAQRRAGEIKRDGADFAEAAADLRKKAEELEDSRQKGKAGRSPACMAAIATAAIFRGCRGFSGFAAFAKADGAWLERRGVHCEACAGPAGERRPESIPASCRRRSAAFRGEGRAPPRRSRIRRERAKGFLPPSCKRSASSGAGGAAKADAAGAFGSKTGAAPAQVLINEKNQ